MVNLKLSFPGANPHVAIEPLTRLDTAVSYFFGNDPAQWHAGVPVWSGVRYKEIYPGLDLDVMGVGSQLTWSWHITDAEVGQASADDIANAIAIVPDGSGKVIIRGETQSTNFPVTTNAFQTGLQGSISPFAAKLNANGSSLQYSTYVGGPGNVSPTTITDNFGGAHGGVGADSSGNAYITGTTSSNLFPTTTGAQQEGFGGGDTDGFVVKLAMPENSPIALYVPAPPTPTPTNTPRPTSTPTITPPPPPGSTATPTATQSGPGPNPPTATPTATQGPGPATPTPLPTTPGPMAGAMTWYFAEGYTGPGFDEYLTGQATITYFIKGSSTPVTKAVNLPPNSRTTVAVYNATSPGGLGRIATGHSTQVDTTVPTIIERPMYVRYNAAIDGGHDVMGYAP